MRLFCDCKTDEEKSNFFLSGMAVETGVIAPAISNDVAMAYHRCAQFKKENDELRAKIIEMEEPAAWRTFDGEGGYDYRSYEDNENYKLGWDARNPNHIGWVEPLYALHGAKGE